MVVGWLQPVRDCLLLFPGFSEKGANVAQRSLPLVVHSRVAETCCHVHPTTVGPLNWIVNGSISSFIA